MLSFVQNFFGPKANPIGVDFGSDGLRLAQVQTHDGEFRLVAAATADVPSHVRHDPGARLNFFVDAIRELLADGGFIGRQVRLALPAAQMFIQHIRLARMDDESLKKALPWELRGKIPIDPSHALLRHLVAGEVYSDHEPRSEVIVMAAARELVNQFLEAAAKSKLDVVGMTVEPTALLDCFTHVYRRKTDKEVTNCFVDIGCAGTRAIIARAGQIVFARNIPIGGDHFNRAVASALNIGAPDAKLLRVRLCNQQPPIENPREKQVILEKPEAGGDADTSAQVMGSEEDRRVPLAPKTTIVSSPEAARVEEALHEPLGRLIEELNLCRRYFEATFPSRPLERLFFVGGESRHRSLCQHIAREMGLAAQVGDPLLRMGRTCELGPESGIDRRLPQPAWAVAIGLSMGPLLVRQPQPLSQ